MPKKLPKGVRSLGDVAKRRGRGGQYLKGLRIKLQGAQRTPRSEKLVTQEISTMKKSRAGASQIEEMRFRQAMQKEQTGRELSRRYKPAAPKPAPKVSAVKRLARRLGGRALGVTGAAVNVGGFVRAHKGLKKRPPKTRMEGITRVAREIGFVIPKGKKPEGL